MDGRHRLAAVTGWPAETCRYKTIEGLAVCVSYKRQVGVFVLTVELLEGRATPHLAPQPQSQPSIRNTLLLAHEHMPMRTSLRSRGAHDLSARSVASVMQYK